MNVVMNYFHLKNYMRHKVCLFGDIFYTGLIKSNYAINL